MLPPSQDPAIRHLAPFFRWLYVAYLALAERSGEQPVAFGRLVEEANLPEPWVAHGVVALVRAGKIRPLDTALVDDAECRALGVGGNLRKGGARALRRRPASPPHRKGPQRPAQPPGGEGLAESVSRLGSPTPETLRCPAPVAEAHPLGDGHQGDGLRPSLPTPRQGLPTGPRRNILQDVAAARRATPSETRENAHKLLVDAVFAMFDATEPAFKRRCAVAAAQMKRAVPPVMPDELPRLRAAWKHAFPDLACTPTALSNHVDMLRQVVSGKRVRGKETAREQMERVLGGDA